MVGVSELDLLAFIQSQSTNPLQDSKCQNFEAPHAKSIETAAYANVNRLVTEKLNRNNIDFYSNSFKCLYLIPQSQERAVTYVKRHHVFIIQLLESKQTHRALDELKILFQHLRNIAIDAKMGHNTEDIWNGVSFSPSDLLTASIMVAFHFLLLQCLLQHMSSNIKQLATNKDKFLNFGLFDRVSRLFLAEGNFMRWINLSIKLNSSLKEKFTKNSVKMLSGYIKIITVLMKNINSSVLSVSRTCLELKLNEFTACPINDIIINKQTAPFIIDLKNTGNPILTEVISRIEPAGIDEIVKSIEDNSPNAIHNLQFKLLNVTPEIINHEKVLKSIKQKEISLSFVKTIISFIESTKGPLSRNTLTVLDISTVSIKHLIETTDQYDDIIALLIQLSNIFQRSTQIKRMRNISNLLYNIGNKLRLRLVWNIALENEKYIYNQDPSPENFSFLQSKVQKIVYLLSETDVELSSLVMMDFLQFYNDNIKTVPALEKPTVFMITKCLPSELFVDKLFGEINISPDLKFTLLRLIFHLLEKLTDPSQKLIANAIMTHLQIGDEFKPIIYYHYYNINGLSETLDLELPDTTNSLYRWGISLQKLIKGNWNEQDLLKIIILVETWILNSPLDEMETEMFTTMILFLRFNGLSGRIVYLINLFQCNREVEPAYQIFLQSELCQALENLGLTKELSDSLTQLNVLLKQLKVNNIPEIINFTLNQFKYCVLIGNWTMAKEKFNQISKVMRSRQDFDLGSNNNLKLADKFQNLILIARFQLTTGKLNVSLTNYLDAFKNVKVSIKVLYSVLKKCGPNMPQTTFHKIKWETTILLFESYKAMLDILKHIGLARDFVYYLHEFEKANSSCTIPLVNCFNDIDAIVYKSFMNKPDKETHFRRIEMVNQNKLVAENHGFIHRFKVVSRLANMDFNMKDVPVHTTLDGIPNLDLVNLSRNSSELEPNWIYLLSLNENHIQYLEQTLKNNRLVRLALSNKKVTEITKAVSLLPHFSLFSESVRPLPSIITPGGHEIGSLYLNQVNNLIQCKETLFSFLLDKELSLFSVYELRDLNRYIGRCLSLIASMTVFKLDTSLLMDLYYLQDLPNSLPFKSDRLLSHNSSNPNDILPDEIAVEIHKEQIQELSIKFNMDLSLYLPESWSIITVDICDNTGDLVISKLAKGGNPFYLRLPVTRLNRRNGELSMDFKELKKSFQDIIRQSDMSTRKSTTSMIKTKDDRKNWWKLRFSLDLKLKTILDHVEKYWFGGFLGIFFNYREDGVFLKFKSHLISLLNRALPSRSKPTTNFMEFDENIFKIFFGMKKYNRLMVEDLVYFVVDSLNHHGEMNRFDHIDFEKLHTSLETLFDKYFNLRSPISNEHLILIPTPKCAFFPWESLGFLANKSVSRVPSVSLLIELLKHQEQTHTVDINNSYYMINPGGDLIRTEERFKSKFESINSWKGLVGMKPKEETFLDDVLSADLFVYLGHGGCDQYFKVANLYKKCLPDGPRLPPSLLIGCSSGALQTNGYLESSGNIYNWLTCGSPMVLVNLWDVTDKDIDSFSLSVFEKWGLFHRNDKRLSLSQAVKDSRESCTLRYLNGAAPIVYGLPLYVK